jgi:ubiquinone/menaquinone biosynthesis C-methylase UbiE
MAVIGKRVIHPGGRASTEALLHRAEISETTRALDVGCGVGTTAIEIARRYRAAVTAIDIAPLMLQRAIVDRDRDRAASEMTRVCRPGGRVLATEFSWREPPTTEAREVFLGQVCPRLQFDTLDDWVRIYVNAGLEGVETETGRFEMISPKGFVGDEGFTRSRVIIGRVAVRPAHIREMDWLMPKMSKAVPYLGYVLVAGHKPIQCA